jgi:hypothetical protein
MTVNDYEVRLFPKAGQKTGSVKMPVKITVRATSYEDARRQAQAQFPNHIITATPRKLN